MQESSYVMQNTSEYISNIPGRFRMKIEILKNNPHLCASLMHKLSNISGVFMVNANHYTGKLLVLYDTCKTTTSIIEKEIYQTLFPNNLRQRRQQAKKAPLAKEPLSLEDFRKQKLLLSNEYYHFNLAVRSPEISYGKNKDLWHVLTSEAVLRHFKTNKLLGLTNEEAKERLDQYGSNELLKHGRESIFSMFLHQFDGSIIKLFLAASGLSFLLGKAVDAITILVIIGVEAALGVLQEYKAEKSLETLKELSSPTAHVIREGISIEIPSSHVVPGDIILLEAGNHVPADARLIECCNLEVIESSLTGESYSILKHTQKIDVKNIGLGDRYNMVYMGTSVIRGKGKAVITGTGMNTEMGKIASMLDNSEKEQTPLQKDLDKLGKVLSLGCIGICSIITLTGILNGIPFFDMLSTGISLAIGAIPEGLTAALMISLAFGVQRMSKKNAIVKTLPSVETLSATKVICTDKTGTLTKNEMTVKELYTWGKDINVGGEGYNREGDFFLNDIVIDANEHQDIYGLLTAGYLCNNAQIMKKGETEFDIKGDPTEAALLIAVEKSGISKDIYHCYTRTREIPFDSSRKIMTAICKDKHGQYSVHSKGAIDTLIDRCSHIQINSEIVELTDQHVKQIMEKNKAMASKALRILALAYKPLHEKPGDIDNPSLEEDMIFLGLIGMMDPPRSEVKDAIQKCHQAGIKVVMITGDHKETAAAVAESINLLMENGVILSGEELDAMEEMELAEIIDNVQVFARTCPQQKLKIVKAFKKKGYIVAMTGDGVNDAPAVKEAHIGIAMGKSGTDVTREASSIILTDDNFNTIVKAVEEGRTVSRNIKKFMKYVLAGNFAEVLAIFLASLSGLPIPLVPGQILMINLVTEGIPALSLGLDPPEKNIMSEPPRNPEESIFDKKLRRKIISKGVACGLATLGIFVSSFHITGNLAKARTMAFANLVSCQMLHTFECSSMSIRENKFLLPSVLISTGIMLASIYVPPLRSIFGMAPLNLMEWGIVLVSSSVLSRIDDFLRDLLFVTRVRKTPSFGV
ncbi:MAG: HAD-IC family P-type ATPase [Bacillota bacterium]